jgi:hypothetical protein
VVRTRSRARKIAGEGQIAADRDEIARLVLELGAEVKTCLEMMNGELRVRDELVACGWQVEVADARRVKAVAPHRRSRTRSTPVGTSCVRAPGRTRRTIEPAQKTSEKPAARIAQLGGRSRPTRPSSFTGRRSVGSSCGPNTAICPGSLAIALTNERLATSTAASSTSVFATLDLAPLEIPVSDRRLVDSHSSPGRCPTRRIPARRKPVAALSPAIPPPHACGDHPAGDLALQLTIGLGHATRPARSREGCGAFSAVWTRRACRPRATSVASASSC